jgi:uncharacterized membrane protein
MENNQNYDPSQGSSQAQQILSQPEPYTNQQSAPEGSNAKLFSILAYVGMLWLLGLLIRPEKTMPFVKGHVNNGILIDIATGAAAVTLVILNIIFALIHLGFLISILSFGVYGGIIALRVIGIINAARNLPFTIPVVGDKIKIVK